jgi:hypothetical protein
MMAPRSTLGLVVTLCASLAAIGCDDDAPPPAPTPEPPTAAPPAKSSSAAPNASASAASAVSATSSATTSPSGSAAASAMASPSASSGPVSSAVAAALAGSAAVVTGPRRWADFYGPELKPTLKEGEKAWAVLPVSVGWDTLKFARLDVRALEDKAVVFSVAPTGSAPMDVVVPTAFTAAAIAPEALTPNAPVLVATSGTRAYGRVVAVEGEQVRVRYRFAGLQEERAVPATDVLRLDGSLRFGAPIAYRQTKEGPKGDVLKIWHPAQLVFAGEGKSWLLTNAGKPMLLPNDTLRAVDVMTSRKAGAPVWVVHGDEFVPATVLEEIENGLRYKVKRESGEESTVTFDAATTPIR